MSLLDEYCRNPEQYYCVLYLDECPVKAAQAYSTHHLHKLAPHAARVLSTVWSVLGGDTVHFDWGPPMGDPPFGEPKYLNTTLFGAHIYRPWHPTHPLVVWAGKYGGNYDWLWRHGMALVYELEKRLGKVHCCINALRALELMPPKLNKCHATWCDLPVVVPLGHCGGAVDAYRNYYREGGAGKLSYRGSVIPEWL